MGRTHGHVVTHRLSAAYRGNTRALASPARRCTCGSPFYAETPEAAQALLDDHFDRMAEAGRPVLRDVA